MNRPKFVRQTQRHVLVRACYVIEALEPRTCLAAAIPLTLGSPEAPLPILGKLDYSGDSARYALQVQRGVTYEFKVSSDLMDNLKLGLTDAQGQSLLPTSQYLPVWTAPVDEEVILTVTDGYDTRMGAFVLDARAFPFNAHATSDSALPLSVGQTASWNAYYRYEATYLQFDAQAGVGYCLAVELDGQVFDEALAIQGPDGHPESLYRDRTTDGVSYFTWSTFQPGPALVKLASWHAALAGHVTLTTVPDDHPGGPDEAPAISFSEPNTGTIDFPGDADEFTFAAIAGQHYLFETLNPGPPLSILDAVGQEVQSDTVNAWGTSLTFTPVADGIYFLRASSNASFGWVYSIRASIPVDDCSQDAALTPVVSLPFSQSISSDFNGDVDTLRFHATQGLTYCFTLPDGTAYTLSNSSTAGILMTGTARSYGWPYAPSPPLITPWTAPASGDYLLSLSRPGIGAYDVSIGELNLRAQLHWDTAVPLSVIPDAQGQPSSYAQGTLSAPGQVDWYSFTATQGQVYTLSAVGTYRTNGFTDAGLALYDASGHLVAQQYQPGSNEWGDPPDNPSLGWMAPQAGTYFLAIYGRSAAHPQSYSFWLTVPPRGGSQMYAQPVTLGEPFEAWVKWYSEEWFSVPVTAGTTYILSTGQIWYRFLSFGLGAGEAHGFHYDGRGNAEWTAPVDGLSHVVVLNDNDNFHSALLAIRPLASAEPENVTRISPGRSISGEEAAVGGTAWYAFSATAGVRYTFRAPPADSLKVVDSDGQTPIAFDNPPLSTYWGPASDETETRLDWIAPRSGEFYLRLASRTGLAPGAYTLSETQLVDDYPDTQDQAQFLADGSAVSGVLTTQDQDVFSFAAQAGEYYHLVFSASSNDSAMLLDAQGNVLGQFTDATFAPPSSGTYHIRVCSAASDPATEISYTLTESHALDDYADTPDAAQPLVLGMPLSGHLDHAASLPYADGFPAGGVDDIDQFSFNTIAGQTYRLMFHSPEGARLESFCSIARADGEVLVTGPDLWTAPETDTFYIRVTSHRGTGPYTLLVMPAASADLSAAPRFSFDRSSHLSLATPAQVQYFSLFLEAGQDFQANLISSAPATIATLAPDGRTLYTTPHSSGIYMSAAATGVYYLRVMADDPRDTLTYSLTDPHAPWQPDPPDPSPSDGSDEDEPSGADSSGENPTNAIDPYVFNDFYTWTAGELDLRSPGQLFSFHATRGVHYRLLTMLESLSDSVLYLLDTDGQRLLASNDDSDLAEDTSSEIDWIAPRTRVYFLLVRAYDPDDDSGRHDLIVAEDANGNSSTTLSLLPDTLKEDPGVPQPVANAFSTRSQIASEEDSQNFFAEDEDPLRVDDGAVYE